MTLHERYSSRLSGDPFPRIALWMVVILWCCSPWPLAAQDRCGQGGILVAAGTQEDLVSACQAVERAERFFIQVGLPVPLGVSLHLVGEDAGCFHDAQEIAHFDAPSRTVTMRDFQAAKCLAARAAPGMAAIANRAQWQSYIVHELAHAAIHEGCDRSCPSLAMHEYVAAIAQISSLPAEERSILLGEYPGLPAFDGAADITELYYAMNPRQFAVKAYKHFRGLSDQRAFLRELLHPR
ncbi:MAG: hypothetical protein H6935_05870 [Thiobacillus sp.]|nr:hypothetical protein [Thiobacillus sp.]